MEVGAETFFRSDLWGSGGCRGTQRISGAEFHYAIRVRARAGALVSADQRCDYFARKQVRCRADPGVRSEHCKVDYHRLAAKSETVWKMVLDSCPFSAERESHPAANFE